jgi:hypothetical protein
MRMLYIAAAIAAAAPAVVPVHLAAQADTTIRVERVMTARELRETGLGTLTGPQRAALDEWLARYTATVVDMTRQSARQTGATAAQRNPYVGGQQITIGTVAPGTIYTPSGFRAFRIQSNLDGGGFVQLDDGTIWEIYLPDRPSSGAWRAGSIVELRVRPDRIGQYDHLLVNAGDGSRASARFAGSVTLEPSTGGGQHGHPAGGPAVKAGSSDQR